MEAWPWNGEAATLDWAVDYPLHASAEGGVADAVLAQIAAGQDVDLVEPQREWTPLQYAAANAHEECCRALVAAGAFVAAGPLLLALDASAFSIVRLLLQHAGDRHDACARSLFRERKPLSAWTLDGPLSSPAAVIAPPPHRVRTGPATAAVPGSRPPPASAVVFGSGYVLTGTMLAHARLLATSSAAREGIVIANTIWPKCTPAEMLRRLAPGTRRLMTAENLGGTSEISEALSFELLVAAFGRANANLRATEREIRYADRNGGRTDFLAECFDAPLAVSVTRVFERQGRGGDARPTSLADATQLLRKKLAGVNATNASNMEGWHRQILHVWAQSERASSLCRAAHALLPASLRAATVVLITVVPADKYGLDRAIFSNAEMSGLDVVAERLDAVDLGAFRRRQQQEWRQLTPLGAPRRRVSRF